MKYFFILLFLGFNLVSHACECPDTLDVSHYYDQSDLIVQGTIVQVTTNWISGGWKYTVKISHSWKRPTDQVLFINSPWEKDCGYIFKDGQEYIIYITKGFTMKTFQCSGNILVSEATSHQEFLGEGFAPRQSPQVTYMYWTISILAALTLFFVGFVVLK